MKILTKSSLYSVKLKSVNNAFNSISSSLLGDWLLVLFLFETSQLQRRNLQRGKIVSLTVQGFFT
jgi:hypothetical protein